MPRRPKERPMPVGVWLAELERSLREVQHDASPEGVHRLRVALARAWVWLRLSGDAAKESEVRRLRRLAAPLRDLDVQRALTGPSRRLEGQRTKAAARLNAGLRAPAARALFRALHTLAPLRPGRARDRAMVRLVQSALLRGAEAEAAWDDPGRLHALRRALRKARYALELAGRDAEALAALQTTLGTVQDLTLAIAQRVPGAHGPPLLRARAKARRQWLAARLRLGSAL